MDKRVRWIGEGFEVAAYVIVFYGIWMIFKFMLVASVIVYVDKAAAGDPELAATIAKVFYWFTIHLFFIVAGIIGFSIKFLTKDYVKNKYGGKTNGRRKESIED